MFIRLFELSVVNLQEVSDFELFFRLNVLSSRILTVLCVDPIQGS